MPVLNSPACVVSVACPLETFPTTPSACACTLAVGGLNDLYFIPCDQVLSETNITDLDWWADTVELDAFGKIGVGLGSIAKKSDRKERVGSCRVEQIVSATWAITYQIKCFDKTSAASTVEQMNKLIQKSNKWLLVVRMCDGEDTILPVGQFTASDFNWTVPDNFEEFQNIQIELSWPELGMPKQYSVAGLSAILPKNN